MLQNMLRTHQGRLDRAPTPADDIAAIPNKAVVCVPDENHRNPLGEAKHQRDLGWAGGQDLRCEEELPLQRKLASVSPFQYYPIVPKTSSHTTMSHKFPTNFSNIARKFPIIFQTISYQ